MNDCGDKQARTGQAPVVHNLTLACMKGDRWESLS